jgi:hypothetical protein
MSHCHDAALMRLLSVVYPDYIKDRPEAAADLLFIIVEKKVGLNYMVEVTSINDGLAELAKVAPGLHPDTVATIRKSQTTPGTFAALFVAPDGTSAYFLEHPAAKALNGPSIAYDPDDLCDHSFVVSCPEGCN